MWGGGLVIFEFYLFRKSGEPVLALDSGGRWSGERVNPCLVSGLLSAVSMFVRDITKKTLRSIVVDDWRFILHCDDKDDLVFAVRVDDRESALDIEEKLLNVKRFLLEKYGDEWVKKPLFLKVPREEIMNILNATPLDVDGKLKNIVLKLFKEFCTNPEIGGAALFSRRGKHITSYNMDEIIGHVSRYIEAMVAVSREGDVKPTLLSIGDHRLIVVGSGSFIVVARVSREEHLGVAMTLGERYLKKIEASSVKIKEK